MPPTGEPRLQVTNSGEPVPSTEIAAAVWRGPFSLGDDLIDCAMFRTAYDDLRLREIFAKVCHGALYFSRCVHYPPSGENPDQWRRRWPRSSPTSPATASRRSTDPQMPSERRKACGRCGPEAGNGCTSLRLRTRTDGTRTPTAWQNEKQFQSVTHKGFL
ncbi:DUF6193 family natural product biosynthesis protein [Streptomyces microflavus]|uniref:DUF6193 family natural product biosynthesis protein n=1 Tax=Streptomyces microflavus TaxID=1919 RepID=UPI0036B695D5